VALAKTKIHLTVNEGKKSRTVDCPEQRKKSEGRMARHQVIRNKMFQQLTAINRGHGKESGTSKKKKREGKERGKLTGKSVIVNCKDGATTELGRQGTGEEVVNGFGFHRARWA